MYYVYVLLSHQDEKFYIGFTSDLKRRFKEHSSGQVSSTKSRRSFKLIYHEAHLSREDAERRGKYFKTTKGKATLRQMLRESLKIALSRSLCLYLYQMCYPANNCLGWKDGYSTLY